MVCSIANSAYSLESWWWWVSRHEVFRLGKITTKLTYKKQTNKKLSCKVAIYHPNNQSLFYCNSTGKSWDK